MIGKRWNIVENAHLKHLGYVGKHFDSLFYTFQFSDHNITIR